MKDLQDQIIEIVRMNGEISINELYRHIGGNRNTMTKTYQKMIKDDYLSKKKSGNKIFITIKNTNFEQYFENFDIYVEWDIELAFREILSLREFRPICKILNQSKTTLQYWVNPKARPHINTISNRINRMFARTAALTYAETMDLVPKKYSKKVKKHNKLCLDAVSKILNKLLKENDDSEIPLKNIISYGIYGYDMLSQIQAISKKPKN